ncbi:MAG: HAD family phosphatase [Oscillospiraceae bacterium]|nr:HAD family phosphatase [Oscillospiraceae bacterium]
MGRFSGWLLVADFDDTLRPYGTGGPVPEANRRAAEEFMAEGGLFTIATGRDPRSYLHIRPLLKTNAPAVLSNGAVLFDGDRLESVYESFLPFSCRADLRAALDAFPGLGMEVHRGADVCVCRWSAGVEKHLRNMGAEVRLAEMERVLFPWTKVVLAGEELSAGENELSHAVTAWFRERFPDKYEAVPAGPLVDVVAAGSDKGTGVTRLAALLDVDPERVVCVGDSWNDLPMLRAAAFAFAPSNALEAVRAEPGVVTVGESSVCLRDVVEHLRER